MPRTDFFYHIHRLAHKDVQTKVQADQPQHEKEQRETKSTIRPSLWYTAVFFRFFVIVGIIPYIDHLANGRKVRHG